MTAMIPFKFKSHQVRVLAAENGEPLFVGKDLCEVLGYADPTNAMKRHCRGVAKQHPIVDALGREQNARVLTEGDMFRLIVNSKLKSAVEFEKLVFDEILPAIRKTGAYDAEAAQWEVDPSNPMFERRKADHGVKRLNKAEHEKFERVTAAAKALSAEEVEHAMRMRLLGTRFLARMDAAGGMSFRPLLPAERIVHVENQQDITQFLADLTEAQLSQFGLSLWARVFDKKGTSTQRRGAVIPHPFPPRLAEDPVGKFIMAALDVTRNPDDIIESGRLYEGYIAWAKRASEPLLGAATFARKMPKAAEAHGFLKGKSSVSIYQGVQFKGGFAPPAEPSHTRYGDHRA